ATPKFNTRSLHDALPICTAAQRVDDEPRACAGLRVVPGDRQLGCGAQPGGVALPGRDVLTGDGTLRRRPGIRAFRIARRECAAHARTLTASTNTSITPPQTAWLHVSIASSSSTRTSRGSPSCTTSR